MIASDNEQAHAYHTAACASVHLLSFFSFSLLSLLGKTNIFYKIMTIIGFDVSKNELVAVGITKRGQTIASHIIPNNPESIDAFLDEQVKKHPHLTMGSEATGEYHNILARCCLGKQIPFFLLNPIVTKQFTRATVRKKKTDLSDAEVIAKCILQGQGERLLLSAFGVAKPILRTASRLAEMAVMVSHMQKRFSEHFEAELVVQDELLSLHGMIQKSIIHLRSIGAKRVPQKDVELLASIPGIGKSISAILVAEIENVDRFARPQSLIAYAGLDPRVRQSGATLKRNTKLTKRGSPYLRRAAYLAASIAQRHDAELKQYYLKKRAEGKRYKEATVANARHILNRVYAVWKRGTPYLKYPEHA
jgi:transposase